MISDMTCREFTEVLASSEPVPGGGSSSAFLAAISAALASMVGSLTIGKPKYADVEDELKELMEETETLRLEFLDLIEQDAQAFADLLKAYSMPKETDDEKKIRGLVLADALKNAVEPPIQTMRKCARTIELCGEFADKGSKLAIADAGVGAVLCKAAMQGAALNVYANTDVMKDRELAAKYNKEADSILFHFCIRADEIYGKVYSQMRKWWAEGMR